MLGETPDQLCWLNRPMCLEWPEEEAADETPNALRQWLVELVYGVRDALASTRASEPGANRRDRRVHAGIASGHGRQASTLRRNV
jgi:hypothetical protein